MKWRFPHLFHGSLANEPLTACTKASQAHPFQKRMDDAYGKIA